ncbi:uncharacterized protein LOC100679276 [Nasonia vitripennis]|uniref:Uncharacterized protein n=1 Tax=Nasonia vitripennis TaxID=7425 RepID=A0A7M7GE27_NASVI|nr:uncharacterized protein LOC100679276 [Nasonia vitripennis]
MLAAQICRELHFGVIATRMQSRVPRCLFGPPNPRDTMELLQEALETERSRFAKRWGVDPLAEDDDKENGGGNVVVVRSHSRQQSCSPSKKRTSPYAKQTSIHDYWRSRKVCDSNKKPSGSAFAEVTNVRLQQQPPAPSPPSVPSLESPPQQQEQQQQNDRPSTSSSQ